MISYPTMHILYWQIKVDHYLNTLPLRLLFKDFTFVIVYDDSRSKKWMWYMRISFLVQVLLNSFLILQSVNYVDIPNLILSASLSVLVFFSLFTNLIGMVRIKSLILWFNNLLELNSYLGKSVKIPLKFPAWVMYGKMYTS